MKEYKVRMIEGFEKRKRQFYVNDLGEAVELIDERIVGKRGGVGSLFAVGQIYKKVSWLHWDYIAQFWRKASGTVSEGYIYDTLEQF